MSRVQKSKHVKKDTRKLRSSSSSSSQAARLSKYRHVSKIRDDEARAELHFSVGCCQEAAADFAKLFLVISTTTLAEVHELGECCRFECNLWAYSCSQSCRRACGAQMKRRDAGMPTNPCPMRVLNRFRCVKVSKLSVGP